MFEDFYNWLQHIDWFHYIALGVVFALLSLAKSASAQPISTSPNVANVNSAIAKSTSRRFRIRKLFPVLRWMLFFAAVLVVLIGIQDMYIALNPSTSFVRGVSIRSDPEISWTGAIFAATGIAILWFGRQWWSRSRSNQTGINQN